MENKGLTFNDFLASKHQYDHSKENCWEALGANEKDAEQVRVQMKTIYENEDKKLNTLSERIEKCLEIDMPTPWKAYGFMKIGAASVKGRMLDIISKAPEELPVAVIKQLLIFAIMNMGD